jgi:hypothetical protein
MCKHQPQVLLFYDAHHKNAALKSARAGVQKHGERFV